MAKNEFTLTKSMKARLKEIPKLCDDIAYIAERFQAKGFDGAAMADMREKTNRLVQAVHEFNAYRNSLETE